MWHVRDGLGYSEVTGIDSLSLEIHPHLFIVENVAGQQVFSIEQGARAKVCHDDVETPGASPRHWLTKTKRR